MFIANWYAWACEKWITPPVTRDMIVRLGLDNYVDATKPGVLTLENLGIEPQSLREVAPTYLKRFRKTGGNPDPAIDE